MCVYVCALLPLPFHISSYLLLRTHFVPLEIKFINDFYFRQRYIVDASHFYDLPFLFQSLALTHTLSLSLAFSFSICVCLHIFFGGFFDAIRPFHYTATDIMCVCVCACAPARIRKIFRKNMPFVLTLFFHSDFPVLFPLRRRRRQHRLLFVVYLFQFYAFLSTFLAIFFHYSY